jgi:hypothetical protein
VASAQSEVADSTQPVGVGFQGRLNVRSMVVAPYVDPDNRFSAALYPRTVSPLSGKLIYTSKIEDRGNFDDNAISFGMKMYQNVELIPVSVDAQQYYDRRIQTNIAERWQAFGTTTVNQMQQGSKGEGVSIGVNLPKRFDQMFGEGGANLRVSGYRRITFSGRSQWDDVARSGIRQQSKFPALNMEQISRFSIQGTIGTKISVSVAQDNQTDIPLANRLIIRYKGDDDDILKTIEAGNTNLAIANTRFVGYSQNISGLFGIKTEAKLGNLSLTAIASQEKGSSESATVSATGEENAEYIRDHQYMESARTIRCLSGSTKRNATSPTTPRPRRCIWTTARDGATPTTSPACSCPKSPTGRSLSCSTARIRRTARSLLCSTAAAPPRRSESGCISGATRRPEP